MSKYYYYLVAGLPELTLEDSKLSYTVADFKVVSRPSATPARSEIFLNVVSAKPYSPNSSFAALSSASFFVIPTAE